MLLKITVFILLRFDIRAEAYSVKVVAESVDSVLINFLGEHKGEVVSQAYLLVVGVQVGGNPLGI